jgi:hypothetical protein
MGKIGLSIYMKGYYEEFHALKAAEKQSQTKPIYSFCVLCAAYCIIDLSFPWKRESSLLGSYGFRIKCGMTCLIACFTEPCLKKQSQF